jgi:hypothetical protein
VRSALRWPMSILQTRVARLREAASTFVAAVAESAAASVAAAMRRRSVGGLGRRQSIGFAPVAPSASSSASNPHLEATAVRPCLGGSTMRRWATVGCAVTAVRCPTQQKMAAGSGMSETRSPSFRCCGVTQAASGPIATRTSVGTEYTYPAAAAAGSEKEETDTEGTRRSSAWRRQSAHRRRLQHHSRRHHRHSSRPMVYATAASAQTWMYWRSCLRTGCVMRP